jgi:hypothetical protein
VVTSEPSGFGPRLEKHHFVREREITMKTSWKALLGAVLTVGLLCSGLSGVASAKGGGGHGGHGSRAAGRSSHPGHRSESRFRNRGRFGERYRYGSYYPWYRRFGYPGYAFGYGGGCDCAAVEEPCETCQTCPEPSCETCESGTYPYFGGEWFGHRYHGREHRHPYGFGHRGIGGRGLAMGRGGHGGRR